MPDDFRASWLWKGRPYCDQCRQPAVVNEHHGVLHVTADEPMGVDPFTDPAGHQASIVDWSRGVSA